MSISGTSTTHLPMVWEPRTYSPRQVYPVMLPAPLPPAPVVPAAGSANEVANTGTAGVDTYT